LGLLSLQLLVLARGGPKFIQPTLASSHLFFQKDLFQKEFLQIDLFQKEFFSKDLFQKDFFKNDPNGHDAF
jgi:hypothetical protein